MIKRIANKGSFVAVRKGRGVKLDGDAVAVVDEMLSVGEVYVSPDSVTGKSRGRILAALKVRAPELKLRQRSGMVGDEPCVRLWAEVASD